MRQGREPLPLQHQSGGCPAGGHAADCLSGHEWTRPARQQPTQQPLAQMRCIDMCSREAQDNLQGAACLLQLAHSAPPSLPAWQWPALQLHPAVQVCLSQTGHLRGSPRAAGQQVACCACRAEAGPSSSKGGLDFELPFNSKILLLAAYFASRNKHTVDKRLFDRGRGKQRRKNALGADKQVRLCLTG